MRALLTILALFWSGPVAAQAALTALVTGDDLRGWEAVGRIDIDGRGFCTGALIAPDLVLTAAHCLFARDTGAPIPAERFTFQAGLRNGRALAVRAVRRALAHPNYVHDGTARTETSRWDVALLLLAQPVRLTDVRPFEVSGSLGPGDAVAVVSYAFDRAEAPALQELCGVIAGGRGVMVLSCEVDFGSSGAPVFAVEDGMARIVSVVSAKAELDGARVAVGMELGAPLADLRALIEETGSGFRGSPPGLVRVLTPGERAETGARFVPAGQ